MKRFDREKIRCGETVLMVKTFQCVSTIREKDRIPRSASVVRFWLLFLNNSLHCHAVGVTEAGSTAWESDDKDLVIL